MGLLAQLHAQTSHNSKFVSVEDNVRLEILDWGGSGRPLLLLAGGGNTAHIYDDFAPKLAAVGHVYGMTRRGFGASGFSSPASGLDRLRDDVLSVMDALKLTRPVLIGHSIAGAEMSAVATLHPDRVAGLVYLDAGYPYAFANGKGPKMQDFTSAHGPQFPTPAPYDLASFAALQKWDAQVFGFQTPEAELRQTWDSTPEGRPKSMRDPPGSATLIKVLTGSPTFADIPAPALVIFADPHVPEAWINKSTDPAVRQAAKTYFATVNGLTERQAQAVEQVRNARVIRLPGGHYIFLTNEAEVLREIRAFLAGLPPA